MKTSVATLGTAIAPPLLLRAVLVLPVLGPCANLLWPLYDLMVSVVIKSRALHTDDTTVKMQELLTYLLSTARMWVYLGDNAHPYNVFDFTLNRKRDGPQQFLANYRGYLHEDAFSGYDGLYLPDPLTAVARIIEVACNARARRKFYEARGTDALRSHQALAYYRQLYELERQAKDFNDVQRLQMRQELSLPILEQFHQCLLAQRPEVLPQEFDHIAVPRRSQEPVLNAGMRLPTDSPDGPCPKYEIVYHSL